MKSKFIKMAVGVLAIAALAGCTDTSIPEVPLTEAEFAIAADVIAKQVPLVVERNTSDTIPTNIYRQSLTPEGLIPTLTGGNDLILTTGGNLDYEDEDNEVYLYNAYTIEWTYRGAGDETSTYASFEFNNDPNGLLIAVPGYPVYEDIKPLAKAARLYAILKIGDHTKTFNIDMILDPVLKVNYYDISMVRELAALGDIVGVRGYVTGFHADWDAAGIVDGDMGLGLYKLQSSGFTNAFKIGDLVEAVGSFSYYNGLAQLSFITKVSVLDPDAYPEIERPITTEFTHDDLKETLDAGPTDLNVPMIDRDNALVKFDSPFKFLRIEDRDAKDVGFAGFDTTTNVHINVVLQGKTSDNVEFEVFLSMNYHIGTAARTAFKDFLQANQTGSFYYEGPLGSFNSLVLGPYHFEGVLTLA